MVRPTLPGVWGEHIHLGVRSHGKLSTEAKAQQTDFDGDPARNGLAGHAVDRTWHPDPKVTFSSHYSDRPDDWARVDGHRDQVGALGRLVEAQLDLGRVDSNFDGLQLPGVVSAWDGREDDPRGTHHEGHRKIDDVFGPGRAQQVELVDHPEKAIDHQGVLAVRRRE